MTNIYYQRVTVIVHNPSKTIWLHNEAEYLAYKREIASSAFKPNIRCAAEDPEQWAKLLLLIHAGAEGYEAVPIHMHLPEDHNAVYHDGAPLDLAPLTYPRR